jgi:hypothetical protein
MDLKEKSLLLSHLGNAIPTTALSDGMAISHSAADVLYRMYYVGTYLRYSLVPDAFSIPAPGQCGVDYSRTGIRERAQVSIVMLIGLGTSGWVGAR